MRIVAYALLCAALIAGALLIAGAPPAKAADAPTATVKANDPLCGKTVPECEEKNKDLMAQIAAAQGVIQTMAREMKNYQTLLTEANDRWAAANH